MSDLLKCLQFFSCFACACVYRLCTNAATYDSLARRFYQLAWPSLATQDQVLDRLGFLHGTPAVFLEVFLENARIEERQVARPKTRFWITNSGSQPAAAARSGLCTSARQ